MVRRDGAAVRRERILEIARIIQANLLKHKGELPLKQTMVTLQYETGLTPEKIMEYMAILENMDQFAVDRERGIVRKVET